MTGIFRIEFIQKTKQTTIVSQFEYAYLIAIRNQNPEEYKKFLDVIQKVWDVKKGRKDKK